MSKARKTTQPPEEWDQFSIKAEIHRRGETLEGLARKSGMSGSYFRRALRTPCTKANRCIAEFLNFGVHVLWPNWFYPDGGLIPLRHRQRIGSTQRALVASHESRVA